MRFRSCVPWCVRILITSIPAQNALGLPSPVARETLTRLGRHAEAAADFSEVIELTSRSNTSELFRAFRALARARLGDFTLLAVSGEAIRAALKLGASPETCSVYGYYMAYYDAACIHAALAKQALENRLLTPAQRQAFSKRDLDRSLELLDKARANGDFQGMIHLDEIRREAILGPLRSDPRFQLLMMDLAFPDSPFAEKRGSP